MLLLRPHHINCIFFFRGLGYSYEFVNGMYSILESLATNPDSKIKLTLNCDALCSNCPNKQNNNLCITEEKVEALDLNALKIYNLKANREYKFIDFINNIYINYDKNKFYNICCTCNWYKDGTCNISIIEEQIKKWTNL